MRTRRAESRFHSHVIVSSESGRVCSGYRTRGSAPLAPMCPPTDDPGDDPPAAPAARAPQKKRVMVEGHPRGGMQLSDRERRCRRIRRERRRVVGGGGGAFILWS